MRNIIRFRPKSFLDDARRDWQFATFAWLLRSSGGYPKFLDTELVLPTETFFPDRAMSGHAGVAALFRRVRDHAGMAHAIHVPGTTYHASALSSFGVDPQGPLRALI